VKRRHAFLSLDSIPGKAGIYGARNAKRDAKKGKGSEA